jgi:hypothetical protein
VQATAPESVRAEAIVCVHAGNDGTCGTTAPSGPPRPLQQPQQPKPVFEGDLARTAGVRGGHVYSRRGAPRLLDGLIELRTGGTLRDVRVSLERVHGGRCYVFSGSRARFVRAHGCSRPSFFSVGGAESFSYLLPFPLSRGRYVYEVQAMESNGSLTKIVPGVSRVGFVVR